MKSLYKRLCLGLLLVSVSMGANANLITNGSFESGVAIPVYGYQAIPAVDLTSITGWTVTNVDYISTYWQASNGVRSIDLNGSSMGSIFQSIATVAGLQYSITFDLSGNPDSLPALKTINVSVGASNANFGFDATGITHSAMGYVTQTFIFTAVSASTLLTFSGVSAGSAGGVVDNVVVNQLAAAVPLPATLALLGLGFFGLALARKYS